MHARMFVEDTIITIVSEFLGNSETGIQGQFRAFAFTLNFTSVFSDLGSTIHDNAFLIVHGVGKSDINIWFARDRENPKGLQTIPLLNWALISSSSKEEWSDQGLIPVQEMTQMMARSAAMALTAFHNKPVEAEEIIVDCELEFDRVTIETGHQGSRPVLTRITPYILKLVQAA